MQGIRDQIKKLQDLLKIEKEEDLSQYKKRHLTYSFEEKRKSGVCWYPIQIKRQLASLGDKTLIEIERTQGVNEKHAFNSGKLVSLFVNTGGKQDSRSSVNGVVNYVKNNTMTITLNTDDLPEWIDDGKLGLDLLFDEASYREMEAALKDLQQSKNERLNHLKEVLLGEREASFQQLTPFKVPQLNDRQNAALQNILQAEDVAIIHGPPGTGKTTTLVYAILKTLESESKVMVCAPSNAATDLLVEKLTEMDVEVLRVGHPARVTESQLNQTIDVKISKHATYKDLKQVRRKSEELKSIAKKYKRQYGYAERQQRSMLLDESRRLREEAEMLEHYIVQDLLGKTQVIACTLVGATSQLIRHLKFQTVFIDEAAQALEPACWIPIMRAQRVVLAGDHCQLPPTIRSIEAARGGLAKTLFEKVIGKGTVDVMLEVQYRMPEMIMEFSSRSFYQGRLLAHDSVKDQSLRPGEVQLEFIDTAGCGFTESIDKETLSTQNIEEANLVLKQLNALVRELGLKQIQEERISFGLIAPYRAQISYLSTQVYDTFEYPNLKSLGELLVIDTVDGFQGQERDVIFISLTRSNSSGEIGFLAETRRMNVAMTRAKKKMVVFGDSATLCSHEFYSDFVDFTQSNAGYRSAYELMEF